MRVFKLTLMALLLISFLGVKAQAQDWALTLNNLGLELSPSDVSTLHQFEVQGNPERQVVSVNLVELAKTYPHQAQQWVDGALPILQNTFKVSLKNESFKRTRTDFLKATMAVLWAEGAHPSTMNAQRIDSVFEKYYHSPRKFYDATAVLFAYSNLVTKNLVSAGPSALKEAAIQFKIAKYKNQIDGAELSRDEEASLRRSRRIASVSR